MAITFGGEFRVARKRDEVYDFLTDPKRFGPLLPDFQGLTVEDERHFAVNIKVGIAHIRSTACVKLHLEETERPHHRRYSGKGSMAGGSVNPIPRMDLEETSKGTRVAWKGEA